MPIESANYIKDLDPTNPAAPDLLADTDNHLRMIKQVLKNTFPNIDAPVAAKPYQLMSGVPIGGIIMWSGSYTEIPTGFVLCTGQTGLTRSDGAGTINAPDLRDKFIKGSLDATDHKTTGGSKIKAGNTGYAGGHSHLSNTEYAGLHSHGGNSQSTILSVDQMPIHFHEYQSTVVQANYGGGVGIAASAPFPAYTGSAGGSAPHWHGIGEDGSHFHAVYIEAVADHRHSMQIDDARPPYYALAFIMRV